MGAADAANLQRLRCMWSQLRLAPTRRLLGHEEVQMDTNKKLYGINDYAEALIHHKARQLVGKAGYTPESCGLSGSCR